MIVFCRTIKQSGWSFRIKIIGVQGEVRISKLNIFGEVQHLPGTRTVPVSVALYRFVPRLVKFEDANLKKKLINYWILKIWKRGGTRYVPHCFICCFSKTKINLF